MSAKRYELIASRCVKCGAPLPEQPSQAEYVKCEYCGYAQKFVDVQEYLDKLRGEIYRWVSSLVPPEAIDGQIVDPVARHNIFVFNIKPKILGEYASIRARLSMQFRNPLVILPFYQPTLSIHDDPKQCFENSVKIQGLEPVAVVDEDRSFYEDVKVTYETYAYLVNAFDLVSKRSDLSFLIKNFEQAAASLEMMRGKEIENRRMLGVLKAYQAVNEFLKGDIQAAKQLTLSAIKILEEVAEEARKSTNTAVMVPSTLTDISTLKTLNNILEASFRMFEAGRPPTEILPYLERYFRVAEEVRIGKGADTKIYEELIGYLRNIVEARIAANQIEALPGPGELLFPLWDVSITYTFATGALLWKKGKEAEDKLLVAATVPLATEPVTNVFRVHAEFTERLKGEEETLSTGFIGNVINQVRKMTVPPSLKVIPPLATKEDAERTAEAYLSLASKRMGGKIKFGSSQPTRLIYAVAEIRGDDIYIPSLGDYQVKISPHLEQLMKIAF